MKTFESSRPPVGAGGVGVARAALEHAVDYSKARVQFGKPIALFQYIAFKMAQMAADINAARFLVWNAAWRLDKGLPLGKESAMAKMYGSDVAMKVTCNALDILGGYGYMKDYPMEKLMRDAKLLQIYEGTNDIQRLIEKSVLVDVERERQPEPQIMAEHPLQQYLQLAVLRCPE